MKKLLAALLLLSASAFAEPPTIAGIEKHFISQYPDNKVTILNAGIPDQLGQMGFYAADARIQVEMPNGDKLSGKFVVLVKDGVYRHGTASEVKMMILEDIKNQQQEKK